MAPSGLAMTSKCTRADVDLECMTPAVLVFVALLAGALLVLGGWLAHRVYREVLRRHQVARVLAVLGTWQIDGDLQRGRVSDSSPPFRASAGSRATNALVRSAQLVRRFWFVPMPSMRGQVKPGWEGR